MLIEKQGKRKKKRPSTPSALSVIYADESRRLGCIVTGRSDIQMHHLEGREFKFKGVHVGHWWQIPIAFQLHDVSSNDPLCVTHHKNAFHDRYGTPNELLRKNVERCRLGGIYYPEEMLVLADEYYRTHENTESEWLRKLK